MIKLLTFLCLSIGLYAESEYEIILLATEGQELEASETYGSTGLNESGYAWFSQGANSFIYHETFGFKVIPHILNENESSTISAVNNHGIAVGKLTTNPTNWWGNATVKIFAYNAENDEFFDLAHPIMGNIWDLNISDSNEITYTINGNSNVYRYNLNTNSITTLAANYHKVNAKGQMTGSSHESNESWFYDLEKTRPLGSLDQFNRWVVDPIVLSPNGLVAGWGLDSYGEKKLFLWDSSSGLKEANLPEVDLYAINDKGQLIGSFEIRNKHRYSNHAFIFSLEEGFIDLGTLPKDRESYARAINNKGQVVGQSENKDNEKAFIWDVEHGMRDLNLLVTKDAGWKNLSDAQAINDSGYIFGHGNYYGVEKPFLLIPKK